ncbi:hypothetical protein TWF696_009307 [Orbilia brochopaga]|uniref:Myb-like DNA-binding domain-containing protein n=1 Tax=Orbilia brochopaga TaxID=3140254 RepID=A0AAV9UJB0_9PEZI
MPPGASDFDTLRFLVLCIDKCDTKAIDYEQIAEETGLVGQKAAYKKLWDIKNKFRKSTGTADENGGVPRTPSKVKKTRSPKSSPRKKKLDLKLDEVAELDAGEYL